MDHHIKITGSDPAAGMDRVALRQAVANMGYDVKAVAQMPSETLRDAIRCDAFGRKWAQPAVFVGATPEFDKKERKLQRDNAMMLTYGQTYGGEAQKIRLLTDRIKESRFPQYSMGARVEESACPACAAGHKPRVHEIKPLTPGDCVPGRYHFDSTHKLQQELSRLRKLGALITIDRIEVVYLPEEKVIEVSFYSGGTEPEDIALLCRKACGRGELSRSPDRRSYLYKMLNQTDKIFTNSRAYVYALLADSFGEIDSYLFGLLSETADMLSKIELKRDKDRRANNWFGRPLGRVRTRVETGRIPPRLPPMTKDFISATMIKLEETLERVKESSRQYFLGVDWGFEPSVSVLAEIDYSKLETRILAMYVDQLKNAKTVSADVETAALNQKEGDVPAEPRLDKYFRPRTEAEKKKRRRVIAEKIAKQMDKEVAVHEEKLEAAKAPKMFEPRYCKKCGHARGCMHPREEPVVEPACHHPFLILVSNSVAREINEAASPDQRMIIYGDRKYYACRDCFKLGKGKKFE
jgi:hypothetical protein